MQWWSTHLKHGGTILHTSSCFSHLGFLVWTTHTLLNDLLLAWEVVTMFVWKCILILSMPQTNVCVCLLFLEDLWWCCWLGHWSLDYSSLAYMRECVCSCEFGKRWWWLSYNAPFTPFPQAFALEFSEKWCVGYWGLDCISLQ